MITLAKAAESFSKLIANGMMTREQATKLICFDDFDLAPGAIISLAPMETIEIVSRCNPRQTIVAKDRCTYCGRKHKPDREDCKSCGALL